MTGATEATLQELLNINQQMAASLAALAGKAAGGGGSGGGGGGDAVKAAATNLVQKPFELVGQAAGTVARLLSGPMSAAITAASFAFNKISQTGQALWQNQMALSQGAIEGANKLSDLTKSLEGLPFGLGFLAKLMTYSNEKLEKNIETYQKISQSGVHLGGSLDDVRKSAANTYLSMSEFADMMKTNTPYLRLLGANSEEGAKNLVKFNSTMIKGELGKGILSLGYSLTEANNLLGQYAGIVGGLSNDQLSDQKKMEASVKAFAEELDLSAQLEGKTREQKAAEMKEAAANSAREVMLSKMTADEKAKYIAAENRAMAIGGKGARDALLSAQLGLPPMTKAAQQFTATMPGANQAVMELGKTVKNGKTLAEDQQKIDKLTAKGQYESAKAAERYGTVANAIVAKGGPLADTMSTAQMNLAKANRDGLKNEEDYQKRIQDVRTNQEKAQKSGIGATVQAQGATKHLGGLMDMLVNALSPLFPIITTLIKGFGSLIEWIGPKLASGVKTLTEFFSKEGLGGGMQDMIAFLKSVFKAVDWKSIGTSIGEALSKTFSALKEIFIPLFQKAGPIIMTMASGLGDVFKDFADIFGSVIDIFMKYLWPAIKPVIDGLIDAILPFWNGFRNIIKAVRDLLKGDFSSAGEFIKKAFGDFWEGIKNIFKGLWEGAKELLSKLNPTSWFGGGKEGAKSTGTEKKSEAGSKSASAADQEKIANDWAWSVFSNKATLDAVPASLKSKVSEILKNPPAHWKPPVAMPTPTGGGKVNEAVKSKPSKSTETSNTGKSAEQSTKTTKTETEKTKEDTGKGKETMGEGKEPGTLLEEITLLNKQTAQLISLMRDTESHTKKTASILASGGNPFKRG